MKAPGYVPDAGDIVWLQFDPQAGHEQAGHRPAVVLSPSSYNGRAGMILYCPTTTRIKGYPFDSSSKSAADDGIITWRPGLRCRVVVLSR